MSISSVRTEPKTFESQSQPQVSTQQTQVEPPRAVADISGNPMDRFNARNGYDRTAFLRTQIQSNQAPAGIITPEDLVAVPGSENVSREFKQKVIDIAANIGMDPNHLMAIMSFESGLRTDAVNPQSGATGLIQFMPETARGLGTTVEQLAQMSPEQQLDYVAKYFEPYKGRLNTIEDAYMAVLYPAAIGKGSEHTLFSQGTIEYQQNSGLDLNRDGRVTVGEATKLVRDRLGDYNPANPAPPTQPPPPTAPPSTTPAAPPANPAVPTAPGTVYTVKPGDTLSAIAANNGTTVDELIRLNPGLAANPDLIYPDQQIKLPGATNGAPSNSATYTVQPGDTLSAIAARNGVSTQALYDANRGVVGNDPNLIQPGQVLTIPGSGQNQPPTAPTAPNPAPPSNHNPTAPGAPNSGGLPTTTAAANESFKLQYYNATWNPTGPNGSANCGPASLAMCLSAVGLEPGGLTVEQSIDHARALMNPGAAGTETVNGVPILNTDGAYSNFDQIAEGIRQAGGTPEFGNGWAALDQALAEGKPVVLNGYLDDSWRAQFPGRVGSGDVGHLNAVLGKTPDGLYIVADPMHEGGTVAMTREQLSVFFDSTGGVPNFVAVGRS